MGEPHCGLRDMRSRVVIGQIAFSRNTRGESQALGPLVKLLRPMNRHPTLLSETRGQ